MKVVNLLVDHWPMVLSVAVVLLSLLNAYATRHPDTVGDGLRRVLLLALDRVSALQSKDSQHSGLGGLDRLKMPLLQSSPPPEIFPDGRARR